MILCSVKRWPSLILAQWTVWKNCGGGIMRRYWRTMSLLQSRWIISLSQRHVGPGLHPQPTQEGRFCSKIRRNQWGCLNFLCSEDLFRIAVINLEFTQPKYTTELAATPKFQIGFVFVILMIPQDAFTIILICTLNWNSCLNHVDLASTSLWGGGRCMKVKLICCKFHHFKIDDIVTSSVCTHHLLSAP